MTSERNVEHEKLTSISRHYRLKAAELARQADAEEDMSKQLRLIHHALSWIQIAENEEELAVGGELN
jgi:hypothetical protein